jgi:hypothetical protein
MLRSFKRFFISNYQKMKLSIGLLLGILAVIFLVFYIIGYIDKKWEYSLFEIILLPIVGSILVGVPLFCLIIALRFFNYYKTRILYYKIVRNYRHTINFILHKDTKNDLNNEVICTLWGNYKDWAFRFSYSLGHPLMITLIMDMRYYNLLTLNELLRKLKLKGRRFNGYGLTIELKSPFSKNSINKFLEKLDMLIDDIQKLISKHNQRLNADRHFSSADL